MRIAVIGLGKIGLPLAVQIAGKGHRVQGVDVSETVVALVNEGHAPFMGEPELEERLQEAVASGYLKASNDFGVSLAQCEYVLVAVPLLIDSCGNPDFKEIDAVTEAIGENMQVGTVIAFETTLPVGTTRRRILPELERLSGLRSGEGFFLAFSPERVSSGRVFRDLRSYPKLVGGVDEASTIRVTSLYRAILDFDLRADLSRPNGVWSLGSSEAAEFAKLAETTFRDVNIALANQFALYSEVVGCEFESIREACNSQPYSHIHEPGVAVGGHCIPVYPHLYLHGDPAASLVAEARRINANMPQNAVERIRSALGSLEGIRVVILGVAYRPGVKESAFSGAFALCAQFRDAGAEVFAHDVLYSEEELQGLRLAPFRRGQRGDVLVLHTAHGEYLSWGSRDVQGVQLVYDGRGCLERGRWAPARFLALGSGRE